MDLWYLRFCMVIMLMLKSRSLTTIKGDAAIFYARRAILGYCHYHTVLIQNYTNHTLLNLLYQLLSKSSTYNIDVALHEKRFH